MNTLLRREEYTALGDFIMPSFVRDQDAIVAKFPKLGAAFLTVFTAKLAFVKQMEGRLVKTEQQKAVTKDLYQTAASLNNELTVLNSYVADAGLNTAVISGLKTYIHNRNIEGAILKLEDLKAYVINNKVVLEEQGMQAGFDAVLADYKLQLETKNALQNKYMGLLKELTEANGKHYDELYGFMKKITDKGKIIFKDSVIKDEYSITKNVSRMRAAKRKKEDKEAERDPA